MSVQNEDSQHLGGKEVTKGKAYGKRKKEIHTFFYPENRLLDTGCCVFWYSHHVD